MGARGEPRRYNSSVFFGELEEIGFVEKWEERTQPGGLDKRLCGKIE